MNNNNPFDYIDVSKIGSGSRFTKGAKPKGIFKGTGLEGEINKISATRPHDVTKKNLSPKNIKMIKDMLEERLRRKPASSGGFLSRRDERDLKHQSRALMKERGADWTGADRKDFDDIIGVFRAKGRSSLRGGRYNDIDDNQGIYPPPAPPAPPPPPRVNLPPLPSNLNNFGGGMRPKI